VVPKDALDGCGNSRPHRDSIPELSSPQSIAMPTELSRPTHDIKNNKYVYIISGYKASVPVAFAPGFTRLAVMNGYTVRVHDQLMM
jgi:hypothetical protein